MFVVCFDLCLSFSGTVDRYLETRKFGRERKPYILQEWQTTNVSDFCYSQTQMMYDWHLLTRNTMISIDLRSFTEKRIDIVLKHSIRNYRSNKYLAIPNISINAIFSKLYCYKKLINSTEGKYQNKKGSHQFLWKLNDNFSEVNVNSWSIEKDIVKKFKSTKKIEIITPPRLASLKKFLQWCLPANQTVVIHCHRPRHQLANT